AGGETLTGVEVQAEKYATGLPANLPAPYRPLPCLYQSTGVKTRSPTDSIPTPVAEGCSPSTNQRRSPTGRRMRKTTSRRNGHCALASEGCHLSTKRDCGPRSSRPSETSSSRSHATGAVPTDIPQFAARVVVAAASHAFIVLAG